MQLESDLPNFTRWHPNLAILNASLVASVALVPAPRATRAPLPGRSSMLWIIVPAGIEFSGKALPGLISAFALATI